VSGTITPHHYVTNSITGDTVLTKQTKQIKKFDCVVTERGDSSTQVVATSDHEQSTSPVTTAQLASLTLAARKLACLQGLPQDFEWCAAQDHLYLVQMRPITAFTFPRDCGYVYEPVLPILTTQLDYGLY